jgi:hypothetical protein
VVAAGVLLGVVDTVYSPICRPGADGTDASLLAPEVLAFVQGNDAPPAAPLPSTPGRLRWKAPLRVGGTLTCSSGGGWRTPVRIAYSFVSASSGRVLQSGAKATYVVAARALHTTIRCRALVTNDGGTLLVTTNASPKVAAAKKARPSGTR